MISEAAGAGVIRQDVQQAIEMEINYRLGEEEAIGALSRWQKELLLLVINVVKSNYCLSQLHAMAAIKAGAKIDQVLNAILYVMMTGMVKFRMVGHEAFKAAEAGVPESQRLGVAKETWAGQEQRIEEIKQYGRQLLHHGVPDQRKTLAEVAPAVLDGYMRMREGIVRPDPLGALPKKIMELAIVSADIVQVHPWGAVRHVVRAIRDGATILEVVEAVALVMIESGVSCYKTGGLEVIEAAEKIAAKLV